MYYVFADSAQSYSAQIYKSWKNIRTKLAQQAANGPFSLFLVCRIDSKEQAQT